MNPEYLSETILKYRDIHNTGVDTLKSAKVAPFPGFSPLLSNRLTTALIFDAGSVDLFRVRFVTRDRLVPGEDKSNFINASEDYPLHCTIAEGIFRGEDVRERDEVFSLISKHPDIAWHVSTIKGNTIEYDHLLLDGASVLLAASRIEQSILKFRKFMEDLYRVWGLGANIPKNLLHITAARMIKLPGGDLSNEMTRYVQSMSLLRNQIYSHPLKLKVDKVITKNTFDFLTS